MSSSSQQQTLYGNRDHLLTSNVHDPALGGFSPIGSAVKKGGVGGGILANTIIGNKNGDLNNYNRPRSIIESTTASPLSRHAKSSTISSGTASTLSSSLPYNFRDDSLPVLLSSASSALLAGQSQYQRYRARSNEDNNNNDIYGNNRESESTQGSTVIPRSFKRSDDDSDVNDKEEQSRLHIDNTNNSHLAGSSFNPPPIRRLEEELAAAGVEESRHYLDRNLTTVLSRRDVATAQLAPPAFTTTASTAERFKNLKAELLPPTNALNSQAGANFSFDSTTVGGCTASSSSANHPVNNSGTVIYRDNNSSAATNSSINPTTGQLPSLTLFRNMLHETLDDFKSTIRNDIQNLHVEVIKQFIAQQQSLEAMLEKYLPMTTELMEALQAARDENERLKLKLSGGNI